MWVPSTSVCWNSGWSKDTNDVVIEQPSVFARRNTGSYYTHDDLVKWILKDTLGPLAAERIARFDKAPTDTAHRKDKLAPAQTTRAPTAADAAEAILNLRVCDPAMGSGHFLVSLVDDLGGRVLEQLAEPGLGLGSVIRSIGFPCGGFSGKYASCVAGSTATTWAFGPSHAVPSGLSVCPCTLNTETWPDSPATYNQSSRGSKASTSGSFATSNDASTFRLARSTTSSLSLPSQATKASRDGASINRP